MEQSILKSTKKVLNVGVDDASFDLDIITHINTAFSILTDLGVGPLSGFVIEDEEAVWEDYFPNEDDPAKLKVQLSKVKTVVFLRTRLLFDPPTVSYLLDSTKEQLREAEWRLNVNREESEWVDPAPDAVLVVDGGDPSGE
jgi:hypothetical protein